MTINGTKWDDLLVGTVHRLVGTTKGEVINGHDGNDVIHGGAGKDIIHGHGGNDFLHGDEGDDKLSGGSGDDVLEGGTGADAIKGGSGVDTISYASSAAGVYLDLANGIARGGDAEGDSFSGIENIDGSQADDVLMGDAGNNVIYGNGGDDQLSGGSGDDVLEGGVGADAIKGGSGVDTISYASSVAGVYLDLANNGIARGGDAEGDTFSGIENIDGSQAGDFLMGDAGSNVIYGDDGRDFLTGRGGADYLDGGAGIDDAEYVDSDAGVTVNLATGTGLGGHAEGDILVNIEYVHGSMFDDHLIGDENANRLVGRLGVDTLEGGAGNDVLLGGRGADILDGGSGSRDAAEYSWSDYGVNVNLATETGMWGDAEGDRVINIEYLYGSDFDDVFTGDKGVNRLVGRSGDDTLDGGAGNDILVGGEGADILVGGAGTRDAADYEDAMLGVGVDLLNGGFAGEASGDTFYGVEYVYGSHHADEIIGDNAVNRLVGRDGDDILSGRGGNDYILGELGNDILIGGKGDDVFMFYAGDGDDVIEDFEAGAGRTDRIWLKDVSGFSNFSDVMKKATSIETDSGTGIKIDFGAHGSITLEGLNVGDLVADDFIF